MFSAQFWLTQRLPGLFPPSTDTHRMEALSLGEKKQFCSRHMATAYVSAVSLLIRTDVLEESLSHEKNQNKQED